MGMLYICLAKASSRVREGIVVVAIEGTIVDGDIDEDESGEVVEDDESCTIIGLFGEVEER